MSDLQTIESILDRAAARRRWDRAWRGLWKGFFIGAILWLLALVAYKVFPIPVEVLPAAAIASFAVALIGFAVGWFRRMTRVETARWLDQQNKLKERLSTALEVSGSSKGPEWRDLVVADAAIHAREIDPRKLLPVTLPGVSRWALLVLLLTAGLGFVPEYRSKDFVQKQQDTEQVKETGRKLAELTKRNVAQRPPIQPATEKAMESVKDVAEKLQTRAMTKPEAIKELVNVSDKIKEQVQDLAKNPALKRMEKSTRESGGETAASKPDLQKRMEDLQKALGDQADSKKMDKLKRDLAKLQQAATDMKNNGVDAESKSQMAQAMANMAEQAEAMGLDLPQLDEAIEALMGARIDQVMKDLNAAMSDLDKMKELAQQLQQLKGQMEKMGKDLADQLDKGQASAAKGTLEKMVEQLKQSGMTPEQMQKMVDEVAKSIDPAEDYGQVAEHLKKAVSQMRQGQKQEASQSLADAAKELEKLMAQGQDMESLMSALEQLKGAQLCIGNGDCLYGYCRGAGQGWGSRNQPGAGGWASWSEGGGLGGSGAGTAAHGEWSEADVKEPADPLQATRVKGQISPGGQMPSITLKGVHVKGEARVKYEEAAAAAQSEAQSALNQEKVPRAYQGAVRDYFDDLKK